MNSSGSATNFQGSWAQSQLESTGWQSGQGLGRARSGRSSAIKVSLKNCKSGMGFDAGEAYTVQWWEHGFNKAAGKIQVVGSEDGARLETNEKAKCKGRTLDDKNLLYSRFVKGGTLHPSDLSEPSPDQPSEEPEQVSVQDHYENRFKTRDVDPGRLTDEQLFAACGGRTAHKGARHGLKMSGKLRRLQEQEAALLAAMTSSADAQTSADTPTESAQTEISKKGDKQKSKVEDSNKKEKKSKRHKTQDSEIDDSNDADGRSEVKRKAKSKSKRKSGVHVENTLTCNGNNSAVTKKSSKGETKDVLSTGEVNDDVDTSVKMKSKKKRKRSETTESPPIEELNNLNPKANKKRKLVTHEINGSEQHGQNTSIVTTDGKGSKKNRKKASQEEGVSTILKANKGSTKKSKRKHCTASSEICQPRIHSDSETSSKTERKMNSKVKRLSDQAVLEPSPEPCTFRKKKSKKTSSKRQSTAKEDICQVESEVTGSSKKLKLKKEKSAEKLKKDKKRSK